MTYPAPSRQAGTTEVALAKPQVTLGAVELVPRPQSFRAMLLMAMEYVGYVIVIGLDWPLRAIQHVDRAFFDNHNLQKLLPAYGALTGSKVLVGSGGHAAREN